MIEVAAARSDPAYVALKEFLIERTGLAYYKDRDDDLVERIGRRLKSLRIDGYGPYAELLRAEPAGKAEFDLLIAELTIGETYFFRDSDQFDALRCVIVPCILESNRDRRTLRIWSAGCANGAEAYSLAVLLRDKFAERMRGWELSILGTDFNRRSLCQARSGRYENWALRGMAPDRRDRIFRPDGGTWLIREPYREGVAFQYHNLVNDVAPSMLNNLFAFDLVLCRNVIIYFDRPTTAAVVSRLSDCLVERGWLLAGHADIDIEAFRIFETVTTGNVSAYRKPGDFQPGAKRPLTGTSFEVHTAPAPAMVEFPRVDPNGHSARQLPSAPSATLAAAAPCETAPGVSPRWADIRHQAAPALPAIEKVRELADAGSWAEADQCCTSLLDRLPLDPLPHFYGALIQEQMGRLAEAEKSLRRSIYLDRRFVLGHYHLGLLLQRNPRTPDIARRSFGNVLALLEGVEDDLRFAHGDGITAASLRELTKMHLEML